MKNGQRKMSGWGKVTTVAVLAGMLAVSGLANAESMTPKYDYSKVETMMQGGMELAPLRQVAESLGFKVSWDDRNRMVTLGMGMGDGMMGDEMMGDSGMSESDGQKAMDGGMDGGMMNGKLIAIKIGSRMATVNGQTAELDYAPVILHDKTYVSKAFVEMYLLGGSM